MFLVHVNDITQDIDPAVEVRLFADDCLVYIPVITVDDQELLNDSLKTIFHWCEKWDMQINFDIPLSITKKKPPLMFSYEIDGIVLQRLTLLSIVVLLSRVISAGIRTLKMYVIQHIGNFVL